MRRWLDRIMARVTLAPEDIFPTEELLDHVPLLIDGIAGFIERNGGGIDSDTGVVAKARELGALRHGQGFDAYELLKEYEVLGAILLSFAEEIVDDIALDANPREIVAAIRRLSEGIEIVRQATALHFLHLSATRVSEREDRLRRFNRMVAHELKNHLAVITGAANLLGEPWLSEHERTRFEGMVLANAGELQRVLENLESLSRLEGDARQHRNILLPQAAQEVARQHRDQAAAHDVRVRIAADLPAVEVHAAAVELALTNYISNAVKYSDPNTPERWVEVGGTFYPREAAGGGGELVVMVRDNGVGVPAAVRDRLFQRFFRAHTDTVDAVGSGLGLSIVRETVESLGGRAWAEFPDDGTTLFAFSLPSRRDNDAAAAGVTRDSGQE